MDVILKQTGKNVGLYIDMNLVTVFKNKDIDYVAKRIETNFKYTKIKIAK